MPQEDKLPQDMSLDDLSRLYTDGEDCDKRIFAEMRTNLQLVAGEHYVREGSKFWNRIRDDKQLNTQQRLKLTKNHIQRITKIYRNEIESAAPGVIVTAANESELSDQKAAEMNEAYWQYTKSCENVDSKISLWNKDFTEIGECWVKVFWDLSSGNKIGYEPLLDEVTGQPQVDPITGQMMASNKPVYGGRVRYETFHGYNVRRDKDCASIDDSPFIILSKLIPNKKLRTHISDPELLAKFDSAPLNEWTVYDNNTGTYRAAVGQSLVKEIYWRPTPMMENGYFVIFCDTAKIAEGELPHGIWPIVNVGFDEQTGNPRAHSIIRHLRPAQVEINRAASKWAEHQVTNGDDKVWIPSTSKVSQGSTLPGIRVNTYTGMKPEITPGRTGDQYAPYLENQIDEIYKLANLPELVEEKPDSQDMYSNLLKSYRFKKKFAVYGQKFERFLTQLVMTTLKIAKASASDDDIILAIGKNEYINIPEFKKTTDLQYQVRIKPRTDDIETQFGKQITLNHMIQYIGTNLDKEDIGQMIRLSPFLNEEQMFKKFTQKYDRVVNDILALDRGEPRPPRKYDDHKYILEAITARMSEPDYERLPQEVQFLYEQKVAAHEQAEAAALAAIQKAQAGFIPSGGYLVPCDFYVPDPNNPQSSKRLRLPSESISWLVDKLKTQGTSMEGLMKLPVGVGQDMASMLAGLGQSSTVEQPAIPMGNMNVI